MIAHDPTLTPASRNPFAGGISLSDLPAVGLD
jgi:hypothetical protein